MPVTILCMCVCLCVCIRCVIVAQIKDVMILWTFSRIAEIAYLNWIICLLGTQIPNGKFRNV